MFPDVEDEITGGAETDREIFESILTEITTAFKTQVGVAHVVEVVGSDYFIRRRWKQSMPSIRSFLALWQQGW